MSQLDKYYRLFGLTPGCSEAEIKKAYRKLAMRLHPDRNAGEAANERFILLTEAYEILLNQRKVTPDHKSKYHTPEDRKKEAKIRYQEFLRRQELENERYFLSLFTGEKWRLIKITSVVGSIVAFFILLDWILPCTEETDVAAYYAKDIYGGTIDETVSLIVTEKGNEYWVSDLDMALYRFYPDLIIQHSRIFHEAVHLGSIRKTEIANYPLPFTFYAFHGVFLPIFLFPLGVRLIRRKSLYYTIAYYFALYISSTSILIYLVANNHWIHLITFGMI